MLAAVVLPALLAPQVRTGQQLRYRTTVTRQMNAPQVAGSRPSVTDGSYTVTVSDATPPDGSLSHQYMYDAALLGRPPSVLQPGVTWTNSIHNVASDDIWSSTVEEANPATGVVRLRLSFQSRGERGFRGDKSMQDEREDGEAIFVRGIMTKLSLQGRQIVT